MRLCSKYTAFKHHSRLPIFSYVMLNFSWHCFTLMLSLAFFFLLRDHGKDTQLSQSAQTILNEIYEKLIIRDGNDSLLLPKQTEFLRENA